jgi:hypothetical protein
VHLEGDPMLAIESLTFENWINILLVFGTFSAIAVALIMPFWIENRRGNKQVLMLARELHAINGMVSNLRGNFDPKSSNGARMAKISEQTGQRVTPEYLAHLALDQWRDRLSLEMWKTYRYEISPEPYMCLSRQYSILEDLIEQKTISNLPKNDYQLAIDRDIIAKFNEEYSQIFAKCKYFSIL